LTFKKKVEIVCLWKSRGFISNHQADLVVILGTSRYLNFDIAFIWMLMPTIVVTYMRSCFFFSWKQAKTSFEN
jgi:hypothetical protein